MRTISADQAAVRSSGSQADSYRVQVKDSGGTWRDLSDYPGFNAIVSVDVSDSVGSPHLTADVQVTREFFKLSLSPYVSASALNRGFVHTASAVPLLALFREFKVDVAITPIGRAPASGDWLNVFHGRVDYLDPASGRHVRFGGRDMAGRIADQQIKKELVYAFAEVGGLAVPLRPWAPGMVVEVGEYMLPASNGDNDSGVGKFFVCDTAGTTGNTEPTWSTGSNINDGTARWDYVGATTSLGLAVEEVIQNLLDANKAASDSSVTLYTPSSPGWAITQYVQSRVRNLQACRALANQIGWDVRQKWRAGTSQFELTLFEPERTKSVADYTFAANEYEEPTKLETTIENIRNVWRGVYSDPADTWPDGTAKRKTIEVSDATSIATFGELFAEISESSTGNVNSATEMTRLLNSALSDCAWPTADFVVRTAQAFPWVELGDLYTFAADGRRSDTALTFAVTGWKLSGRRGKLSTEFQMRGKPALSAWSWISQTIVMPFAQGETQPPPKLVHFPGGKNPSPSTLRVPGGVGIALGGATIAPAGNGDTEYEVHVSQSSGFTPDAGTLKGVIKGQIATVQELQPGVTHYGKIVPRVRERSGRLARGQPGAQFSFEPSHVKAGLLDRLATSGGIPNSDFKDIFDTDPENSTTPPEHWTLDTGTFGPGNDARNVLDGTYGMVLSLEHTGTNATVRSAIWRLRMGVTDALLTLRVKQTGTQSSGRNLHVEIVFYSDAAGGTPVGSYDTIVPNAFAAVNTWAVFSESIVVPDGASYAQVRLYKEATSSAYGWQITNVEINESSIARALPAWIPVGSTSGYASGWAGSFSSDGRDLQYRIRANRLELRGSVDRASGTNTLVTTLPAGYRPLTRRLFGTSYFNGSAYAACRVDVDVDGRVLVLGTASGFAGVNFDIAMDLTS